MEMKSILPISMVILPIQAAGTSLKELNSPNDAQGQAVVIAPI
jgi:hypothetical protein